MKSLYSKANVGSQRLDTLLKMNQEPKNIPIEVAIEHHPNDLTNDHANELCAIPILDPLVPRVDKQQQEYEWLH